ncbi:Hypothetical predicted protein [Marmota monax]|uniref:Uncharacterized protein n=1 Tax=Marmota monax TaxID=9995 RepID=A0A5E4BT44_MARMO|nr:Hypothetical predicted protein [Marmota monax]
MTPPTSGRRSRHVCSLRFPSSLQTSDGLWKPALRGLHPPGSADQESAGGCSRYPETRCPRRSSPRLLVPHRG